MRKTGEIGKTVAELLFDGLMKLRSPYTPKSITLPSIWNPALPAL